MLMVKGKRNVTIPLCPFPVPSLRGAAIVKREVLEPTLVLRLGNPWAMPRGGCQLATKTII